jgi:uncharacterized membrane protein
VRTTLTTVRRIDPVALAVAAAWFALYTWRSMVGHFSLGTNAFDLSVFDYALWNLVHHGTGHVPFMGYSIFSHHFMPILVVLAPAYALFQSPVFLLILQLAATAGAALALAALARGFGAERFAAIALSVVFLCSRRTHSAVAGYFYPECFQALLTFALVLAWPRGGWKYWAIALLLLATKEDAAIYVAAFALVALVLPNRKPRQSALTFALACAWFLVALVVAIPMSRAADGLAIANPLLESRFGAPSGQLDAGVLAARVFSATTAGTVVNLLLTVAALPLAGAVWLLPAIPGILINVAAEPGSLQAALSDHYSWPVLPWLFVAAAAGIARVSARSRRIAFAWTFALLVATLADNPALRRTTSTKMNPNASAVRAALPPVAADAIVLAQPNLIPHLPHRERMFATGGGDARPTESPDLILLTEVGNLWPDDANAVRARIASLDDDPSYDHRTTGALHVFVRRDGRQ